MKDFSKTPPTSENLEQLARERILIMDGAMGTMIQQEKLEEGDFDGQMKHIMAVLLHDKNWHPQDDKGSMQIGRNQKPANNNIGGCRKLPAKYICGCLVMTGQVPKTGPCKGDTKKNTDNDCIEISTFFLFFEIGQLETRRIPNN